MGFFTSPLIIRGLKLIINSLLQTSEFSFEASGTAGALPLQPPSSASLHDEARAKTSLRKLAKTPHF
jgi:hypothetical protein